MFENDDSHQNTVHNDLSVPLKRVFSGLNTRVCSVLIEIFFVDEESMSSNSPMFSAIDAEDRSIKYIFPVKYFRS